MADQPSKPAALTRRQKLYFPITMDKPDTGGAAGFRLFGGLGVLLGVVMIGVGGYFIMFGPESIRYSRFSGPTFYQFLELYPGPITSAGFLVAALARYLLAKGKAARIKLQTEAVVKTLAAKGIGLDDFGDDYRLSLQVVAGDRVSIILVDKKAAEAKATTTAPQASGGV